MTSKASIKTLYRSVNPLNNVLFHEAQLTPDAEIEKKLERAHQWFRRNRHQGQEAVEERFDKLSNVHALLLQRLPEYAKMMTEEMGKPLAQSEGEVVKCA